MGILGAPLWLIWSLPALRPRHCCGDPIVIAPHNGACLGSFLRLDLPCSDSYPWTLGSSRATCIGAGSCAYLVLWRRSLRNSKWRWTSRPASASVQ
ncbi:hypothetical protein BV20DRAFT_709466 [Pilatotrama ljubarskyi]|nr:hypothetical protein BV20DRAFT_709466 [Pilatotrama ljubarskyi]